MKCDCWYDTNDEGEEPEEETQALWKRWRDRGR
jgi:hypothetical protein